MNHAGLLQRICLLYGVYSREIGNMDEGIVEGCEDAGDAKYQLACGGVSMVLDCLHCATDLRGPEDRGRCSPEQGAQPSSWEAYCVDCAEVD